MAQIVEKNFKTESLKWKKFFVLFLSAYTIIFIISWFFSNIQIYIFYLFTILVLLCAITAVIRKYSIAEFIFILAWFLLLGIAPHFLYQDIPIIPFVLFILFFTFLYLLFSWEMNRSEIIEVRSDDPASLKLKQKLIIELENWLSNNEIKFRKEENKLTIEIGEKKWIWITLSDESTETLSKYIIELKTHRTKESAEYAKIKGFIINFIKNS